LVGFNFWCIFCLFEALCLIAPRDIDFLDVEEEFLNVCVRERVGVNREGVKIVITESEVLFNKTLVDVELREFHESSQIYIYYILATENKIILKIRPHIGRPQFHTNHNYKLRKACSEGLRAELLDF
jgi:hypothetical protein